MFKEHRLIFDSSTIESPNSIQTTPDVQQTPQLQSGIERAIANADVKVKLKELKAVINNKQTTEERMLAVEEMTARDRSESVIQLANDVINNETEQINTERKNLTEQTTLPSGPEITQQLQVLQQRSELIIATRKKVQTEHNIQLQEDQTFIGGMKTALSGLTEAALPAAITERMTKERKALTAIVGTVGLAIAIPLALKTAKFAWDHSPLGWLFGKLAKKESSENAQNQTQQPEKSGFLKKMLGFTAVAGIGILAGLGISKYVDLKKQLKFAQEKIDDLKNTAEESIARGREILNDVVNGSNNQPEDVNNNQLEQQKPIQEIEDVQEGISKKSTVRSFIFEHKAELGDLDEVHNDAIFTIIHSNVETMSPQAFIDSNDNDIHNILNRNENSLTSDAENDMCIALKNILESKDISEYETMKDFFNDTLMGSITERISVSTEGKPLQDINLAKIGEAALMQQGDYITIIEKPEVKKAINELGLTNKEFLNLIVNIFTNNPKSINDKIEDTKLQKALDVMQSVVQSEESLNLIEQFGHNKNNANFHIRKYVSHENKTNLTHKDTLEIYVYLQLMKNKEGKSPSTIREGNPSGTYLMQMKSLEILSKSNPGLDTIKSVQTYLFNEILLNANTPEVNLPKEVTDQLKSLTVKAIKTMLEKIIDTVTQPIEYAEEWYKDIWERYPELTGGITFATALSLMSAAGFEIKNIFEGMYLKKRAKMNEGNMHRFGFFDTQNMEMAVRNAEKHAELKRFIPRGMFDIMIVLRRTPVFSQLITQRAIIIDSYLQQRSLAKAETLKVSEQLSRNSGTSHINKNVVEQLQKIAQLSEVNGAGSIGNQDFFENLRTWWNQDRSLGKKLTEFITGIDGIDWQKTTAIQKIINDVKANRIPSHEDCTNAGLSTEASQEFIESLKSENIGTNNIAESEDATTENSTDTSVNSNSTTSNLQNDFTTPEVQDNSNTEDRTSEFTTENSPTQPSNDSSSAEVQNNALPNAEQLIRSTSTDSENQNSAAENTANPDDENGNSDVQIIPEEPKPSGPDNRIATVNLESLNNMEKTINDAANELVENGTLSNTTIQNLENIGELDSVETIAAMRNIVSQKIENGENLQNSNTPKLQAELTVYKAFLRNITAQETNVRMNAITDLQKEYETADAEEKSTIKAEQERMQNRIDAINSEISSSENVTFENLRITQNSETLTTANTQLDTLFNSLTEVIHTSEIEELNDQQLTTQARLEKLTQLQREGRLQISNTELSRVRTAIETDQSSDFIIESNADGSINVNITTKIK